MTTQRPPPVLDILLTKNIEGPSPGRDPYNSPIPGPVTTVKVWSARMDYQGKDFVTSQPGGLQSISDTRFVVRAGGIGWQEGDTIIDDAGDVRHIRGVSEYPAGRGRFLELLARRIGN